MSGAVPLLPTLHDPTDCRTCSTLRGGILIYGDLSLAELCKCFRGMTFSPGFGGGERVGTLSDY